MTGSTIWCRSSRPRMDDRQVIEWDKDDIDALKFMKVDVLALGMLGCMRRAFDLLRRAQGIDARSGDDPAGGRRDLRDDPQGRYARRLPDREPRADGDAAADEAADLLRSRHRGRDRPAGPDPGRHGPSLSPPPRGQGEAVDYPTPELRARARQDARACRCSRSRRCRSRSSAPASPPGEADQLRRAMATFKFTGGVSHFHDKLVKGMVAHGYHAGLRRDDLQADRGLRLLRLSREPRRLLRADRLCVAAG